MSKIEKIEIKKMGLLECMDKAHQVLCKSELTNENINEKVLEMEDELLLVMDQLSLSNSEALWFCILYNINSDDIHVSFKAMATYLKTRVTLVYRFGEDIGKLANKGLVRKEFRMNRSGKLTPNIKLTDFARKLVHENLRYEEQKRKFDFKKCQIQNIKDEIRHTVHLSLFDFDHVNQCYETIESILQNNKDIRFVRLLSYLQFREKVDKVLLVYFCAHYIDGFDDLKVREFLEHVSHDATFNRDTIKRYKARKSELFIKDWIRFSQGLNTNDLMVSLTDNAYNKILRKDFPKLNSQLADNDQVSILKPDEIKNKELFYNPLVENEVKTIQQVMEPERLNDILDSMDKNGMTKGFTILFHGDPGTGKTETAMQLARQSNRIILQVNMSQVKSMWVGESEKNLQKVFEIYRYNIGIADQTPILLLNEADALLGKRINVQHSVDQMNNSMQNIMLQALEKFEGILIATTNLKQNLDMAFDRRFLYKIDFTKPEPDVRRKIIDTMLPEVPDYFRIMIAESYSLTGAQLENIKKKYHVQTLILNQKPDIGDIERWCQIENESAIKSNQVGFKIRKDA